MTSETFDQIDEETWPDQKNDNDEDKYTDKDNDTDKLLTCDIWDTDYNYDNWEPEFMTIFVTWQLRVKRDSIRNSCDICVTEARVCFRNPTNSQIKSPESGSCFKSIACQQPSENKR